jgi:CheY-like chemotaxis protein
MRRTGSSGLRVLVADDYPDIADSMAFLLEAYGHRVQVARDGPATVESAVTFKPDVILLDIGMPRLDGYAAANQIRQRLHRDVILIALTAWARREDQQRANIAGVDFHMAKPPDIPALVRLLQEISTQKQRKFA